MKLLEYEAKTILRGCGIKTPDSVVITKLSRPPIDLPVVLKSQVPTGGRAKAGGVKIIDDKSTVDEAIDSIFSLDINGFLPSAILAEQKLNIVNEYYFSLVINNQLALIELVAHKNGGIEVESNDHDSFLKISLSGDNFDSAGQQLADYLDLASQTFVLQDLIERAYRCFIKNDMTLLEINPLVLTAEDEIIAGDCKMVLDGYASFRHPEWKFEDAPIEANFVTLNQSGNIATIANGAGLAMATVDAVTAAGLSPANFLDIGGGANAASVLQAFERIVRFDNVQAIVINIFAGITKCDDVAEAIITASQKINNLPPLFIRLAGTNSIQAVITLQSQQITTLQTLADCIAAAKEVCHE